LISLLITCSCSCQNNLQQRSKCLLSECRHALSCVWHIVQCSVKCLASTVTKYRNDIKWLQQHAEVSKLKNKLIKQLLSYRFFTEIWVWCWVIWIIVLWTLKFHTILWQQIWCEVVEYSPYSSAVHFWTLKWRN